MLPVGPKANPPDITTLVNRRRPNLPGSSERVGQVRNSSIGLKRNVRKADLRRLPLFDELFTLHHLPHFLEASSDLVLWKSYLS